MPQQPKCLQCCLTNADQSLPLCQLCLNAFGNKLKQVSAGAHVYPQPVPLLNESKCLTQNFKANAINIQK